jgi:hypothetical protein
MVGSGSEGTPHDEVAGLRSDCVGRSSDRSRRGSIARVEHLEA